MSESSVTALSDSLLSLRACVARLSEGPWKFIRLRGAETETDVIDADDVDLLGSRESVHTLLNAAFTWVRAGECHLRVRSGSRRKVGMQLISTDGRHRLHLDLWIDLWQIDGRKRRLIYRSCAGAVLNPDDSIQRLPLELEASVFVHHLVSKRKKISTPKQLARLSAYAAACKSSGHQELALALETTAKNAEVNQATSDFTLGLLDSAFQIARPSAIQTLARRVGNAIATAWFQPPGKLRMLGMMGCDGCGKTTLCKRLFRERKDIRGTYTGKHLYRKWFVYKLLVIFVRPLLFQGREKFDDTFAPLAYLLACLRLRLKLLRPRKGITLIDRSIMDFLMVARKTDAPRFSGWLWLASVFGVRLAHVHFIVPFERLKERKLEMTEKGHTIYDAEMFRHFSRRAPTDYVAFDNRETVENSTEALSRIVDWLKESC